MVGDLRADLDLELIDRIDLDVEEVKLREAVFRDPFATMKTLFSDQRTDFVRTVWRECKPPAVGTGAGNAISSEGMFVHRTRLPDGRDPPAGAVCAGQSRAKP